MTEYPYIIIGFYKFIPLNDLASLKQKLLDFCQENSIKGTILLASEGINSTLSCANDKVLPLRTFLTSIDEFRDLDFKFSGAKFIPFKKMKVRLKKQTLTFPGISILDPAQLNPESYATAEQWNDIIADPQTIVLDTRNHYEYVMGAFEKAINPGINNFSELQGWAEQKFGKCESNKDKTLAMYCTGGKRCEKAYFFFKNLGFARIIQLNGGIQRYLENCLENTKLNNNWHGNLFVFDDRVAIDKNLNPIYEG